jgi:hypothetical protein
MHSDEKFWPGIWAMALVFVLAMITACTINTLDRRDKWEKAVSNGADPMVAACALDGVTTTGETAICTILAQNRK